MRRTLYLHIVVIVKVQRGNTVANWNKNQNIAMRHKEYFADGLIGAAAPSVALTPRQRGPWRPHRTRRQGRLPAWTAANGRPWNRTETTGPYAPKPARAMARSWRVMPSAWSRLQRARSPPNGLVAIMRKGMGMAAPPLPPNVVGWITAASYGAAMIDLTVRTNLFLGSLEHTDTIFGTGPTNHESYDYGNNRRAGEGKFKGVTVLFTPIHILLADRGDGKGNMKRRRALARAAVASRATDADPKFTTPTITTRIMMSMSNVTINIVIRDNRAS